MLNQFILLLQHSTVFKLLMMAVVADTVFGVLRAVKFRCFNSSVGIDGAIRKVAMMFSAGILMLADVVVSINLINFVPEGISSVISIEKVGMCEFFCILFVCYECISILKNMRLCGVPVPKKVGEILDRFLKEMTEEMPDNPEKKEI